MKVKLRFKNKDNQIFGSKELINLSEAKDYFKRNLEKNENIIEVYCIHFDGWHWHRTHTFKGLKNEN
jgi:hypothetical protein